MLSRKTWIGVILPLIFVILICLAFLSIPRADKSIPLLELINQSSPQTPPMPEVKFDPPLKSPVLEQALKLQHEYYKAKVLNEKLWWKEDIKIYIFVDSKIAEVFQTQLLEDKESKKIFRYFSSKGISIYLCTEYRIGEGFVHINALDGAKKTAQWLATGKI